MSVDKLLGAPVLATAISNSEVSSFDNAGRTEPQVMIFVSTACALYSTDLHRASEWKAHGVRYVRLPPGQVP